MSIDLSWNNIVVTKQEEDPALALAAEGLLSLGKNKYQEAVDAFSRSIDM